MGIKNGLVTDNNIGGIPVKVDIIQPSGLRNVRTLIPMVAKGITVHNTGNTGVGSGDEAHGNYLKNVEKVDKDYVSWHFTVDEDSITQHLPMNEVGYHAGDGGNGPGNGSTIGIEIAECGNYVKSEANGIKLICWLLKEYNFSYDSVKPHRYYSLEKKLCPRRILKSENTWSGDWTGFINTRVKVEYGKMFNSSTTVAVNDVINIGDTVRLSKSAIQWNGSSIGDSYKAKEYKVQSIGTDGRTVLTINNIVMYAVDKKYLSKGLTVSSNNEYLVKVNVGELNIRKGPGTNYDTNGSIKNGGVYTIVETVGNWGKLKSSAGYICLDYVDRI